ncbi:MAG: EVE domain-containing protein [Candidatus Woesebacteria bacterium]
MSPTRYWVAVVSKEHAMRGVAGGFMQVCHGKQAPLKRMKQDDWMVVYSPKQTMEGKDKLQAFTAIGQATDEEVYQFEMTPTFIPFRRNMKFYDCKEISILPLIDKLDFIQDKKKWGFKFRFGFFEIGKGDFELIRSSMIHE